MARARCSICGSPLDYYRCRRCTGDGRFSVEFAREGERLKERVVSPFRGWHTEREPDPETEERTKRLAAMQERRREAARRRNLRDFGRVARAMGWDPDEAKRKREAR